MFGLLNFIPAIRSLSIYRREARLNLQLQRLQQIDALILEVFRIRGVDLDNSRTEPSVTFNATCSILSQLAERVDDSGNLLACLDAMTLDLRNIKNPDDMASRNREAYIQAQNAHQLIDDLLEATIKKADS